MIKPQQDNFKRQSYYFKLYSYFISFIFKKKVIYTHIISLDILIFNEGYRVIKYIYHKKLMFGRNDQTTTS